MEQFHAFRDARPEGEKWELIGGLPVKKDRPTLAHQRIASSLQRLLNCRLEVAQPEWQADCSVNVWLKGDEKYNPEPDVTVIDAAIAMGQIYVERFYFVAEILSESDRREVLEAKLAYYQEHVHNKCVLFVRQDRVGADQHDRAHNTLLRECTLEPLDLQIALIGYRGDGRRGVSRGFAAGLAGRWLFSLEHSADAKFRRKRMPAQATAALK
jgi:Uma2 family endonuclease